MQNGAQRIRTVSGMLVYGCTVASVLLPLSLAAYWVTADDAQLIDQAQLAGLYITAPLTGWQRGAGALLSLLPAIALSAGLWHARSCFRLFTEGRFFELGAIRGLRGFAAGVMWAAALRILAQPLLSVVMTATHPPGQRQLVVSVSSEQLLGFMFGLIVWVIAGVMMQARILADEHAQFV